MKKLILKLAPVIAAIVLLASWTSEKPGSKALSFDVALFESKIKTAFDGKAVGHGYAIFKDGKLAKYGGDGKARTSKDSPELNFTTNSHMDIASSTKCITAMAVMKELYSQGKTEEEKIYKYCPSSWVIPAVNKQISFRQLLGHISGLVKFGGELQDLKKTMETPTKGVGTFLYNNVNYALCRVLLAYLDKGKDAMETGFDPAFLVSSAYQDNVRKEILKTSGLIYWDKAGFNPWNEEKNPSKYTLYYNFASNAKGSSGSDHFNDAGAGGLYVSASELGQILSAAENGKSMPKSVFQVMKNKMLGFDANQSVTGGICYYKGGDFTSSESLDQGAHSRILFFPNNVQVAWLTNSNNNSHAGSINAIINAYQASWK